MLIIFTSYRETSAGTVGTVGIAGIAEDVIEGSGGGPGPLIILPEVRDVTMKQTRTHLAVTTEQGSAKIVTPAEGTTGSGIETEVIGDAGTLNPTGHLVVIGTVVT
jgi:hypothetical protein